MMDRRLFLIGSAAAVAACTGGQRQLPEKRMAITMDDFNQSFDIRLSLEERHKAILDAFNAVDHKAAGFVTGSAVNSPWGKTVLRDWKKRGHLIANHTWSHEHANQTEVEAYLLDISETAHFLADAGYGRDYFRFPFLDDGRDRKQQVSLFAGLENLKLKNAPVTIDTVDWFANSRLETALRKNPKAELSAYREYYVTKCVKLADHWHQVATALGFKSLPHLTLIHHNIINGLFLKDVLLALQKEGWAFVNAKEALAYSAFHALPPEPTKGRNWLTLKANEAQINIPPYPVEYYGFGRKTMDALGL